MIIVTAEGGVSEHDDPVDVLGELQEIVGGWIEVCESIFPGYCLVIDEEGKCKSKPVNLTATSVYKFARVAGRLCDPIVGTAVLIKTSALDKKKEVASC